MVMPTTTLLFGQTAQPSVPIYGLPGSRFGVRRIFCIGRNYADHVKEMGAVVDKGTPVFFTKPADSIVSDGRPARYPSKTQNLHFEGELVVALGAGGAEIGFSDALGKVYGYACGNDLTRRDLQHEMKAKSLPWDIAKAFDDSAAIGEIMPVSQCGHLSGATLALSVNGERKQFTTLAQMIFPVAEVICELSRFFTLAAGDLIFTGTPAGVAPLNRGDTVEIVIDGLPTLRHRIV
jgi:fumarylpyruvate hydrolase